MKTFKNFFIALIVLVSFVKGHAQLKSRPFHVGFIYPASTNGTRAAEYSNAFSVHAISGVSGEERGFAASGIATVVKGDTRAFTASGIANVIGGHASGFTSAGFINLNRSVSGFSAAGFANITRDSAQGFQGAGFMNLANDVDGVQVSGFINKARNVHGAQIGIINIAESSKYAIGLVNIIKDGEKAIGITVDDNATTLLAFRSGTKRLYGIVGVGANLKNEKEVVAIQVGLGTHLITTNNFRLKAELTSTLLENYKSESKAYRGDFSKHALTVLPSFTFGKFEVFAGPSLNFIDTDSREGSKLVDHYFWDHHTSSGHLLGFYLGYVGGVQLKF
jgi:hypothetical protein